MVLRTIGWRTGSFVKSHFKETWDIPLLEVTTVLCTPEHIKSQAILTPVSPVTLTWSKMKSPGIHLPAPDASCSFFPLLPSQSIRNLPHSLGLPANLWLHLRPLRIDPVWCVRLAEVWVLVRHTSHMLVGLRQRMRGLPWMCLSPTQP